MCQIVEQAHGFESACHIEKCRRLVENNYGSALGERLCYHGFLAFAIGELRHKTIGFVFDAGIVHGFAHAVLVRPAQTPPETGVRLAPERYQLGDGESACHYAVGGDDAYYARTLELRERIERGIAKHHISCKWLLHAGDGA